MTVGALALVVSFALAGCDSKAQRIREINEVLATPAAERTPLSAEIDAIEISVGDCVNSTLPEGISIETVVIVTCADSWQYRVVSSFDVADSDRYPGESFFKRRAYENCNRRFSFILLPPAESWSFGDRTVNCLQESFGLAVVDPSKLDRLVNVPSLRSGECFNEARETGGLMVELVDCSGDWELRVLNAFDVAETDRYPGESFFKRRAYENCNRRFSFFLFPPAESWSFGDRTVHCLQESFGLAGIDPSKLDRLVNARSMRSGECFNEARETGDLMVELVDCSGDWELRVLNAFDVAESDRYPGEHVFEERAHENCDRQYDLFHYPNRESWESGDRTITCLEKN